MDIQPNPNLEIGIKWWWMYADAGPCQTPNCNWMSYAQNVVFGVKKRGPSCPNWGQGGGFRWFGQCPKENVFFLLMSSLISNSDFAAGFEKLLQVGRVAMSKVCLARSAEKIPAGQQSVLITHWSKYCWKCWHKYWWKCWHKYWWKL